jgi:hypothetical protein
MLKTMFCFISVMPLSSYVNILSCDGLAALLAALFIFQITFTHFHSSKAETHASTVSLPTTLIAAMTDNDIFPVKSFFCPDAKTLYAHQNCNISAAEWSLGHFAINWKECTALQ